MARKVYIDELTAAQRAYLDEVVRLNRLINSDIEPERRNRLVAELGGMSKAAHLLMPRTAKRLQSAAWNHPGMYA